MTSRKMVSPEDLADVVARFSCPGTYQSEHPYGSGHINDTFLVTYDESGVQKRYIRQRINEVVFRDIDGLMDNIRRVTEHQQWMLAAEGLEDAGRRSLRLIPTVDGQPFLRDERGDCWRLFDFVEGASSHDEADSPDQVYQAAKAFGAFQQQLSSLEGRLVETIPGFHDGRMRLAALETAIAADPLGRAGEVAPELAFVRERSEMAGVILDLIAAGQIPERVSHNDTKLNNVMLDDQTGEGICVIDLDTVMPGSPLYDFGDMARTATSRGAEDETDLSRVGFEMDMFEALVEGFLEGTGGILLPKERELLPFSARYITFLIGIRFLTDYLKGDVYFKTKYPGHNLDRCRNQFHRVRSMEDNDNAMARLVSSSGVISFGR